MKVEFLGKNMQVSDQMKERVEEKLGKYNKYFQNEVMATVSFSHVRTQQIVEITIPLKNDALLRVEETSHDMNTSIDKAVDKLDRQIRKHKTAMRQRYVKNESIRYEYVPDVVHEDDHEQEQDVKIVRTKNFPIKPMDAEEAVMQMRLLGHSFYVFQNAETEEVNVVYQRKNGGFGLIEPTL